MPTGPAHGPSPHALTNPAPRVAGFVDVDLLDVTAESATTARARLTETETHADELAALEPPGVFEERQRERRTQLAAIDHGLLRRGLFSAARPQ